MLQALEDLHTSTAHRDLKPDNIMLTGLDTGRVGVKIVDWANSCSIHGGEEFEPRWRLHVFPFCALQQGVLVNSFSWTSMNRIGDSADHLLVI